MIKNIIGGVNMENKINRVRTHIQKTRVIFSKDLGGVISKIAEKFNVSEYAVEMLIDQECDRFDVESFK